MKGFAIAQTCKAVKKDGVWVPVGEFKTQQQAENDITLNPAYASNNGGVSITVDGPMPRSSLAMGAVLLKPVHRGADIIGYGNSASRRNEEIIKPQNSRVAWHVYTDNGIDPPYYLYHFRLDPTGVVRDIWGVQLYGSGYSDLTYSGVTAIASVPFASACVQAADEILDVLYRLEVNVTGSLNNREDSDAYAASMLNLNGGSKQYRAWVGAPAYFRSSSINVSDSTPVYIADKYGAGQKIIYDLGINIAIDFNDGTYIPSIPDQVTAALVGSHIGGTLLCTSLSGQTYNYGKFLSSAESAVQNIFGRSVIPSILTYSDPANSATGGGVVTGNDNGWAPPDNIMASVFRIHVTAGGASGVSTYRIYKKTMSETNGNSWASSGQVLTHLPTFYGSDIIDKIPCINAQGPGPMDIPGCGLNPVVTTCLYNSALDTAVSRYRPVFRYIAPEWISADNSGIAIHDLDSNYEVLNATSTFPLPVTDATQIVNDSTGDIFVACRNTGLYKVSKNPLSPVTGVARIIVAAAVDDAKCFGVQVDPSDNIWALLGKEMCFSADGGTTWTIYNEASDPQFLITGFTSGANDFSFTAGIFRRNTPDVNINQFYIPTATALYGNQGTWWSLEGSSPASDESAVTGFKATDAGSIPLIAQMKIAFSSKGTLVTVSRAMSAADTAYFSFGVTANIFSNTSNTSVGQQTVNVVNIITADNGTEYLVGASGSTGVTDYVPCLRNLETLETGNGVYSYTLASPDITSNAYVWGAIPQRNEYGSQQLTHIGSGIFVSGCYGIEYDILPLGLGTSTDNEVVTGHVALTLGGHLFNTFKNEFWESYGWNGSAWVRDNVGSKVTHAVQEDLMYGAQVAFEDTNGLASDYITNEYYDMWMFDGVVKDDATALSFTGTRLAMLPNVSSNTFSAATVPAVDEVWVDRPIKLFNSYLPTKTGANHSFTATGAGVVRAGMSLQHTVSGDFTLKFKYSDAIAIVESSTWTAGTITNNDGGYIGLFPVGNMSLTTVGGPVYPADMIVGVRLWHSVLDDAGAEKKCALVFNGVIQGAFVTVTGLGILDEWSLVRTGTGLELFLNGVSVISVPGAPVTSGVIGTAVAVTARNSGVYDKRRFSTSIIDMKLSTTFTGRRYVHMGSVGSGHGLLEDAKFLGVPVNLPSLMSITLDGVLVAYVSDPTQAPAQGECTLLYDGTLWFNSADAGKTVAGGWSYSVRNL